MRRSFVLYQVRRADFVGLAALYSRLRRSACESCSIRRGSVSSLIWIPKARYTVIQCRNLFGPFCIDYAEEYIEYVKFDSAVSHVHFSV